MAQLSITITALSGEEGVEPMKKIVSLLLVCLLALSAVFGIFGLTVGLVLFVSQLCALYSYGTEFTAPFSPAYSKGFVESLIELPIFRRDTRPEYYEPIDLIRMK